MIEHDSNIFFELPSGTVIAALSRNLKMAGQARHDAPGKLTTIFKMITRRTLMESRQVKEKTQVKFTYFRPREIGAREVGFLQLKQGHAQQPTRGRLLPFIQKAKFVLPRLGLRKGIAGIRHVAVTVSQALNFGYFVSRHLRSKHEYD